MDRPMARTRFDKSFTVAIALFTVTLAVLFFLQSSLFALQTVTVTGNVYLRESDLLAIAQIETGQSIFNIDLRSSSQLLANHPQIESVRMTRRLPSTLVIVIVEREPVAVVPTEQGFITLSVSGRVLGLYDEIRFPLPLLTGIHIATTTPGTFISAAAAHDGLRIASALQPDLVVSISEIRVGDDGITLLTRDAITVQLGQATQVDEKLATLRPLLKSLAADRRKVERIDLRVPRTPVLR